MGERVKHEPGKFCWVELATKDGPAAKKFYTSLFDWRVNELPTGDGATYSMLEKDHKEAGALYELTPQQKGTPPHWNSYIRVASADDAAAKSRQLGGKILTEPFDVMDQGRMANIQDPTGATFAVWEAKKHTGAEVVNEPGAFCWNELYTPDPKKAGDFYARLFGWTRETMPLPTGQEYTIFKKGDAQAAGMMELPSEWKVPPHWLVYFAVDDSDRTVSKASGMGAKVMMPPTDIPNVGRFAILNDPQGADFAVIHMETPSQS
ncbi:MAG TPA: VOC family protein [Thermoanaerobaculia bacterium]